jgi:hypothetical protein
MYMIIFWVWVARVGLGLAAVLAVWLGLAAAWALLNDLTNYYPEDILDKIRLWLKQLLRRLQRRL